MSSSLINEPLVQLCRRGLRLAQLGNCCRNSMAWLGHGRSLQQKFWPSHLRTTGLGSAFVSAASGRSSDRLGLALILAPTTPETATETASKTAVSLFKLADKISPHTLRLTAATWPMQIGVSTWDAAGSWVSERDKSPLDH